MKTFRFSLLLGATLFSAVSLLSTSCSAQEKKDDAKPAAPPAADSKTVAPANDPDSISAADSWDSVKNCTYDQRADFATGLAHMTERMDAAIVRLKAKRATLPQTSVKDWDFAMKELTDSRSDLRFQVAELDKATPETWNDVKDKIAQAWQRTRDAYDKVRTSTTA